MWREATHRAHELVAILDRREVIPPVGEAKCPSGRERRTSSSVAEHIHRRAEKEAQRVLELRDTAPSLPHSEESVLRDLLCLLTVPGDEAHSSEDLQLCSSKKASNSGTGPSRAWGGG